MRMERERYNFFKKTLLLLAGYEESNFYPGEGTSANKLDAQLQALNWKKRTNQNT